MNPRRMPLFVMLLAMLAAITLFMTGCFEVTWTRFVWDNKTHKDLWVDDVDGFSVRVAPGALDPRMQPCRKEASYGEAVRVSDEIVIHWRLDGKNFEQKMNRATIGLPRVLTGVTTQFSYQTNNSWTVSVP